MQLKYLITLTLCTSLYHFPLTAQNRQEKFIKSIIAINLNENWTIEQDSNIVRFLFTDTMALCQYPISPVHFFDDTTVANTYKLELTFEKSWTKHKARKIQKENAVMIDKVKKRIIDYCESINWRTKTNREWVEQEPMRYAFLVPDWTAKEKEMLKSIKRIPNYIINKVGIWIELNTLCVKPKRKNTQLQILFKHLNGLGIDTNLFQWYNEKY